MNVALAHARVDQLSNREGINHFVLEPEQNTFRSVVADITHRCNMTCANCYLPNRNIPDMDVEKLYDVLARLPFRTYVRLIGAEPTMRDDLPDIIRNVVRLGHKPSINTNGLKLAHLDYCQELKDAGLSMVSISMNGADDDDVYRIVDNGKYATLKTRALTNMFKTGFLINTGTVVVPDINEHCILRQMETIAEAASEAGVDFISSRPWNRVKIIARFKSVGAIGRHMSGRHYSLPELIDVMAGQLDLTPELVGNRPAQSGLNYIRESQASHFTNYFPYQTGQGEIMIQVMDWSRGLIPDAGSVNRGRITKDWKIAPFFEDVKLNETGY